MEEDLPKAPLNVVRPNFKCTHPEILVDQSLSHVECGKCGEKLNPIWVLGRYATEGNRYSMRWEAIKKVIEKAEKKNKCKCQHCARKDGFKV